ncbi:MAG: VWA domain-containing protein, partial [Planctomycetota bacterium]
PSRLARFAPLASRGRPLVRLLLAATGLLLLAVSLVGPVRGHTLRETYSHGLDIVACLDTSRSMLARDLRPDRLERAKRELRGLFDLLAGDRCAILAFAGEAREVAPLTHDLRTLAALLAAVSPADNRRGGTDLAAAISRALEVFDGRTGAHEVIVVLTDGEDLEGRAATVAAQAKERGIRVFVVGVGTEGGGKIPVADASGKETFLRGPDGEEVVTRLAGATLENLARVTGGEYLSTEQSPTPLEDLYRHKISRIEGQELVGGKKRIPHDRYQWSLVLALLCMLGEAGMRERRGRSLLGRLE